MPTEYSGEEIMLLFFYITHWKNNLHFKVFIMFLSCTHPQSFGDYKGDVICRKNDIRLQVKYSALLLILKNDK